MGDKGNLIEFILFAFIAILLALTKIDDKTKGEFYIGVLMFICSVILLMIIFGFSD